jgi:hypothetical protein
VAQLSPGLCVWGTQFAHGFLHLMKRDSPTYGGHLLGM